MEVYRSQGCLCMRQGITRHLKAVGRLVKAMIPDSTGKNPAASAKSPLFVSAEYSANNAWNWNYDNQAWNNNNKNNTNSVCVVRD